MKSSVPFQNKRDQDICVSIKGRTSLLFLGGAFRLDTNMLCASGMQAWAHPRWDQIPPKGPLRPLRYTLNSCMKGICFKHFVSLPQGHWIRLQLWEHNHTNWNKWLLSWLKSFSAIWKNTLNYWIVFIKSEQMNEQLINVCFYSFIEFILQKLGQSCSHLATVGSRWMLYQTQHGQRSRISIYG